MNNTVTFVDGSKKFQFTVKEEFLKKCRQPENFDFYALITDFKLPIYLHNLSGPAIVNLENNDKQYWINGQNMSHFQPSVAKELELEINFAEKILRELD